LVTNRHTIRLVTKRAVENLSDEYPDLVRNAAGGDARALENLLMRAQEVAYRFSHTVCGGPTDAGDVMQDAPTRVLSLERAS